MADRYNQRWLMFFAPKGATGFAVTINRHTTLYSRHLASWEWSWMAHEDTHKLQFARLGWWGFIRRYIGEYLRGRRSGLSHWEAYRNISLEREARGESPALPHAPR